MPKIALMMLIWTPYAVASYIFCSTYFHLRAEYAWFKAS